MDSGIENMEVEDSDRREKRNLAERVTNGHVLLDKLMNDVIPDRKLYRKKYTVNSILYCTLF